MSEGSKEQCDGQFCVITYTVCIMELFGSGSSSHYGITMVWTLFMSELCYGCR
jgi:hypothetical protein